MRFPFYHVDAFTCTAFGGNQAGVCILDGPLPTELMQEIASENNIAETAFVRKSGDHFKLQWFTPTVEIPLCGHGTVATAHVLRQAGIVTESEVCFETMSGLLPVRFLDEGWIELNFPAFSSAPATVPQEMQELFKEAVAVLFSNDRYLIELASEASVRQFRPDFEQLKNHRVVITSRAGDTPDIDFVSRYFAVPVGVPEDPVTGSAHCSLAPYWFKKLGKKTMKARQVSARGGILKLEMRGDRVLIAGKAITLISGEFELPTN